MTRVMDLHRKRIKEARYRKAHEALAPEFELARALIEARAHAGLTQETARATHGYDPIGNSAVGERPEQTLQRLATATGTRLKISFEPAG